MRHYNPILIWNRGFLGLWKVSWGPYKPQILKKQLIFKVYVLNNWWSFRKILWTSQNYVNFAIFLFSTDGRNQKLCMYVKKKKDRHGFEWPAYVYRTTVHKIEAIQSQIF
jgi:hypothetical protein